MFVVDGGDDKVFAYKHSDESQDSAKNLALISANTDPEGMWFDGRVLWVVDDSDDHLYAYDLPTGQPDNAPADGDPRIDSTFSRGLLHGNSDAGGGEWFVHSPQVDTPRRVQLRGLSISDPSPRRRSPWIR